MEKDWIGTYQAESTPSSHNTPEGKGSNMGKGRRRTSRDGEYRSDDVIMQLKFLRLLMNKNIFLSIVITRQKPILKILFKAFG